MNKRTKEEMIAALPQLEVVSVTVFAPGSTPHVVQREQIVHWRPDLLPPLLMWLDEEGKMHQAVNCAYHAILEEQRVVLPGSEPIIRPAA